MKVIIEGVGIYDGEYEVGRLTNRDIHTIKKITGLRPLEYDEAAEAGDTDFVVAFAIIAVRQSARFQRVDEDVFWDAPAGQITLDTSEGEETAADPPSAPGTPTSPSGAPSQIGGVIHQVRSLEPTGTDTSAS